jgi:SAM-dependent methyltransferase
MMSDALIHLLGVRGAFLHGDPFVWDRWKWVRAVLRGGSLRTLDAGCGTGAFSFYADRIGNDCVGLSFDEENNRRARRRAGRLGCGKVRFCRVRSAKVAG